MWLEAIAIILPRVQWHFIGSLLCSSAAPYMLTVIFAQCLIV